MATCRGFASGVSRREGKGTSLVTLQIPKGTNVVSLMIDEDKRN